MSSVDIGQLPNGLIVGETLRQLIDDATIGIDPIIEPDTQINPTHIDLRLDSIFLQLKETESGYVSPGEDPKGYGYVEKEFFHEVYYLHPGRFVLGQTLEYISLPDCVCAMLDGKSSHGRRGLIVHATATNVDPGWCGHLAFELANIGIMPIKIYPGMKVGRIMFQKVPKVQKYKGSYLWQVRITAPPKDEEIETIWGRQDKSRPKT